MTGPSQGAVAPADVSVLICTYDERRWDAVMASVASVRAQSPGPGELIVCADSNPDLAARLRATVSPDVRVVEHRGRPGLSGARNTGVNAADGSVVAFLDDDARARPGWLASLCRAYREACVIGVGGAILPDWAGGRPPFLPGEFDWVVGCTYRGMPWTVAPVRNVIGANMSFRRAVLDEVGGFDGSLGRVADRPAGCEETELCIRIKQRWPEAEFVFTPSACVDHLVPRERGTWRYFLPRCYAEGQSKAILTGLRGSDSLSSERTYVTRTLPRGAADYLKAFVTGQDRAGMAKVGAIMCGLSSTVAGYAIGSVKARAPHRRATTEHPSTPLRPKRARP